MERRDLKRAQLDAIAAKPAQASAASLKEAYQISLDRKDVRAHRAIAAECARRAEISGDIGFARRAKPEI